MLIIWDTEPGKGADDSYNDTDADAAAGESAQREPTKGALPIKTIFDPHAGHGILAADFSTDSKWLFTLGAGSCYLYPSGKKLCSNFKIQSQPRH